MREREPKWTREQAMAFLHWLRPRLDPRYELGMAGSVLFEGKSSKDLDVIIFPKRTTHLNSLALHESLRRAGMALAVTEANVKARWLRDHGSRDEKHVEVWMTPDGRRVDFFFLR